MKKRNYFYFVICAIFISDYGFAMDSSGKKCSFYIRSTDGNRYRRVICKKVDANVKNCVSAYQDVTLGKDLNDLVIVQTRGVCNYFLDVAQKYICNLSGFDIDERSENNEYIVKGAVEGMKSACSLFRECAPFATKLEEYELLVKLTEELDTKVSQIPSLPQLQKK